MNTSIEQRLRASFLAKKSEVKRRATGALGHDYLVPAGPYCEQWDWDAFFIGMSLANDIPSEAIYLKNWALNYLEYANKKNGFTPGLITPKGTDKRLNHMKPFLAQGMFFASRFLNDFSWIEPHITTLEKIVTFRERNGWHAQYGLAAWTDSMESGADNNVAALDYPRFSVLAADLNALLYREYIAMSLIAKKLRKEKTARVFRQRAVTIKRNILRWLWSPTAQSFFNRDTATGELIQRHTYSNILPLWAGIAPRTQGRIMVKRYWLNANKMWSRFGLRTLAKDDPEYNNKNIIKPYSNWQGPVWPIANFLSMHALLNYGFQKEAAQIAERVMKLCWLDLQKSGGMHENYDAETGKPLAAPNFVSWNLLVANMLEQTKKKINPFRL